MNPFNADFNAVLRYQTEQERKAFEDAIDANPLESTNHLVYADWLDEHGEPDEAEFRRAMGEWMQDHHRNRTTTYKPILEAMGFPWSAGRQYPKGVPKEHIQEWDEPDHTLDTLPADPTHALRVYGHHFWQSYRDMESAFRKAFFAGRQPKSE